MLGPLVLLDVRVQVVVPSKNRQLRLRRLPLPALLADSAGQSIRNGAPVAGAQLQDFQPQSFVLVLSPWPLRHGGVEDLLPAMQALDVGAALEEGGDPFPVFGLNVNGGSLRHAGRRAFEAGYPEQVSGVFGAYLFLGPVTLGDGLAVGPAVDQRRGQLVHPDWQGLVVCFLLAIGVRRDVIEVSFPQQALGVGARAVGVSRRTLVLDLRQRLFRMDLITSW